MTKQIALTLGAALIAFFGLNLFTKKDKMKHKEVFQPKVALLGDVGGTNIRLELVVVKPPHDKPQRIIRQARYKVKQQPTFQGALKKFLEDLSQDQYPQVAAVAMAGPVMNNKISMANVPLWGQINGDKLGQNLKIKDFRLMNDFQACTYGLLVVPDQEFVNINEYKIDKNKTIGIIGPGTGLGNSLLYTAPFRYRKRVYVLPSQGGHTDFPCLDDQTVQFFNFMKKNSTFKYISTQRSFCGPAIPYMYRFFLQKFPEGEKLNQEDITSESIIQKCKEENPSVIFQNVLRLFLKLYGAAISNFATQHMCVGGLILVGSLTNSLLSKIKNKDLMKQWKQRHPEISKSFEELPVLVCKQVDLGLKGAYVMSRRIIADEQHDD